MSTRAIVVFKDGKATCAVVYRQTDGYPSGLGEELREFLSRFTSVNTANSPHDESGWFAIVDSGPRVANGIGCLAAQVVAHFKTQPGDIYLQPEGVDWGAEFRYTVFALPNDTIGMRVEEQCLDIDPSGEVIRVTWRALFDGPVCDFDSDDAEAATE